MPSRKLIAPVCVPSLAPGGETLGEAMRFVGELALGIWADERGVRSHAALMMAGEFAAMGIAIHPHVIESTSSFGKGFEAARDPDRERIRSGVEAITARPIPAGPRLDPLAPADVTRAVLRELNGYHHGDIEVAVVEVSVGLERCREWRCVMFNAVETMPSGCLDGAGFDNRGEAEARRAALVYALGFRAIVVECLRPVVVLDAWTAG